MHIELHKRKINSHLKPDSIVYNIEIHLYCGPFLPYDILWAIKAILDLFFKAQVEERMPLRALLGNHMKLFLSVEPT